VECVLRFNVGGVRVLNNLPAVCQHADDGGGNGEAGGEARHSEK